MRLRESIENGVKLFQTEKFAASGKPLGLRALIEAAAVAPPLPRDGDPHLTAARPPGPALPAARPLRGKQP
jgi:hypothetical protein